MAKLYSKVRGGRFSKHLVGVQMEKTDIKIVKHVYFGQAIVDLPNRSCTSFITISCN